MGIHGDKTQMQRSKVIKSFKEGNCKVMIATDVAARGLDINNVEYVVNYDFPLDIENYVHRIGRTARSDKKGTSITLITDNEARFATKLVQILRESNQTVPEDLLELVQFAREEKIQTRYHKGPVANRRMNEERRGYNLKKFVYKGLGEDRYGSRQPMSRSKKPNWDHEGFVTKQY
jgi:superfamily II DNA/RNA helicase